jgi:hypothetical protein
MAKPVVIMGWEERHIVRPKGGRSASRASNIKMDAAGRLDKLVKGELVGRGVENQDEAKEGWLLPVSRIEGLIARIESLHRRLQDAMVVGEDETPMKREKREVTLKGLYQALQVTKEKAQSIWADLAPEEGTPELAVKFIAAMKL